MTDNTKTKFIVTSIIVIVVIAAFLTFSYITLYTKGKEKRAQRISTEQLFDSSVQIQKQTIWFGSEYKKVELLVASPSSGGWVDKNTLYIKKEGMWERINIPEPFDYKILSVTGILHDEEHVIIIIEGILGKKASYSYNLVKDDFALISKE